MNEASKRTERHSYCVRRSGIVGQSGFSLLEVMIAMAIVGIAMVSLLALENRSIAVQERLQRITVATMLAQHKMTEVEVNSRAYLAPQDMQEGDFEDPFTAYRWRFEFLPTPLSSVTRIEVRVSWGKEEKNDYVSLCSFLF